MAETGRVRASSAAFVRPTEPLVRRAASKRHSKSGVQDGSLGRQVPGLQRPLLLAQALAPPPARARSLLSVASCSTQLNGHPGWQVLMSEGAAVAKMKPAPRRAQATQQRHDAAAPKHVWSGRGPAGADSAPSAGMSLRTTPPHKAVKQADRAAFFLAVAGAKTAQSAASPSFVEAQTVQTVEARAVGLPAASAYFRTRACASSAPTAAGAAGAARVGPWVGQVDPWVNCTWDDFP